jgi:hypothetical protein
MSAPAHTLDTMTDLVRPPRGNSQQFAVRPCTCVILKKMRDPETIETELMEIAAIADETIKLDAIIAWCAAHPDEVPFALHHLMSR